MRHLLPLAAVVILVAFLLNFTPVKRQILYKLNISGDTTTSCCTVENVLNSSGAFDENANVAIYNGQIVDYPKTSLAQRSPLGGTASQVLGTNTPESEKWIEVSLDQQKLRAWEGNRIVMEFPISSGLWSPTPKGDFSIWYKTRNQRMKGGSRKLGTYYDLPNVPNNMFFYQGYAIHGAYWHNNFGHPMSHGCVNSPLASVAQLFEWAGPVVPPNQNAVRATAQNSGTRVFIH